MDWIIQSRPIYCERWLWMTVLCYRSYINSHRMISITLWYFPWIHVKISTCQNILDTLRLGTVITICFETMDMHLLKSHSDMLSGYFVRHIYLLWSTQGESFFCSVQSIFTVTLFCHVQQSLIYRFSAFITSTLPFLPIYIFQHQHEILHPRCRFSQSGCSSSRSTNQCSLSPGRRRTNSQRPNRGSPCRWSTTWGW